jgi:octaprenyl-diphosphate synthase
MDICWHRDISVVPSTDEYYSMCSLKTGSLARLAAELGAHAAEAPQKTAQVFSDAAETMGVGFQIMDDVKNLTTGVPGKKRGDDVVEGKKSFPILLYLHKYPEKKDQIFYYFYAAKTEGSKAPEVEELIEALTSSGVIAEAEEKGLSLLKQAKDIYSRHEVEGLAVNENSRVLLDGLINLIS